MKGFGITVQCASMRTCMQILHNASNPDTIDNNSNNSHFDLFLPCDDTNVTIVIRYCTLFYIVISVH